MCFGGRSAPPPPPPAEPPPPPLEMASLRMAKGSGNKGTPTAKVKRKRKGLSSLRIGSTGTQAGPKGSGVNY